MSAGKWVGGRVGRVGLHSGHSGTRRMWQLARSPILLPLPWPWPLALYTHTHTRVTPTHPLYGSRLRRTSCTPAAQGCRRRRRRTARARRARCSVPWSSGRPCTTGPAMGWWYNNGQKPMRRSTLTDEPPRHTHVGRAARLAGGSSGAAGPSLETPESVAQRTT